MTRSEALKKAQEVYPWAKLIAHDRYGNWDFFECKPRAGGHHWITDMNKVLGFYNIGINNSDISYNEGDWQDSLFCLEENNKEK